MVEQRRSTRYASRLYCKVLLPGHEVRAEILDISKGGARISFPTSGLRHDMMKATAVSIDDLGYFQIEVKWHAGPSIGIMFKNTNPAMEAYLADMERSNMNDKK